MRKLIILAIVLTIGLSIVYGIYKWGTSGNKDTQQKTEQAAQAVIPPAATQAPPPLQQAPNEQKVIDNSIGLSFKYDKTVWGNISALPLSKLANTGILVDLNTREVLWAKKPKLPVPIASMTKMMTLLLIMEGLQKDPSINLDTVVHVTREASKIGGSQAWLDPREEFTIRELLKTIVVHSANDSTYLLAQYFGGGDAETFVNMMNEKAKELHLSGAYFSNPDGLPEKNKANENKASAEDMAFLAERLLQYPVITEFAKLKSIVFRPDSSKPITFVNTNKLVRWDVKGINGMKTGYTARAGFCITATCERDGRTLVAVVTGFKTSKNRDKFVRQLLEWGFRPTKPQKTSPSTKVNPNGTFSSTTQKTKP